MGAGVERRARSSWWRARGFVALGVVALLATACPEPDPDPDPEVAPVAPPDPDEEPAEFRRIDIDELVTSADMPAEDSLEQWEARMPVAEGVEIPSSADDHVQPAMWLPASGPGEQPLLVVLHSWSFGYQQNSGIPFARWAYDHGWAMIHPHFRGEFDRPEATMSDLVVQDVLDAIDFAVAEGDVDEEHVYVLGHSGGGSLALLMAGRHPERFAGAVAWVPIMDLTDWYAHTSEEFPEDRYPDDIEASCTGDPTVDDEARAACRERSPLTHLDGAREAGVPIYVGHGLQDELVLPDRALLAFNELADEADRVPEEVLARARDLELPEELDGSIEAETFFADEDPTVRFARGSADATVVLFDGEHDMVFNPGLEWLVRGAPRAPISQPDD